MERVKIEFFDDAIDPCWVSVVNDNIVVQYHADTGGQYALRTDDGDFPIVDWEGDIDTYAEKQDYTPPMKLPTFDELIRRGASDVQ
jgi:hypothetical protein